jgi:uncharacterized iron-regulated membrane protein
MFSTESPPLTDVLHFDSEHAPSNGRSGRPYRSSGFKNAQFRSDRPSIGRRLTRSLVRFFLPVFIGVGGTLAWQYYGGEMVRAWAPSLGWLLPASPPGPAVTSTELQQQLKPMAIDLALVRRSEEQLAANQDQLARKQDQMAQAIATLQAAEQDLSQKMSAPPSPPPAPKPVHVSPKQAQPPAQ